MSIKRQMTRVNKTYATEYFSRKANDTRTAKILVGFTPGAELEGGGRQNIITIETHRGNDWLQFENSDPNLVKAMAELMIKASDDAINDKGNWGEVEVEL